jgi:hypothetical protein
VRSERLAAMHRRYQFVRSERVEASFGEQTIPPPIAGLDVRPIGGAWLRWSSHPLAPVTWSHLRYSVCGVPRLSEFYGIVIYMYWKDHAPPHFHAIYAGQEAQIRIDDGSILAGTLPTTAARLVREWAELRRPELAANWERAQQPNTLEPIDPLR